MSACGETRDFLITAAGPSDALMCASRVLLANETEVKALEGGGSDPHWSGDRMESASEIERLKKLGLMHEPFDAARPLSETNERAAIRRVASAATNILAGYGTTEEEDLERLRDVDPVVLGLLGYDDDRYGYRYGDSYGDGERGVWSGDSDDDDSNSSLSHVFFSGSAVGGHLVWPLTLKHTMISHLLGASFGGSACAFHIFSLFICLCDFPPGFGLTYFRGFKEGRL